MLDAALAIGLAQQDGKHRGVPKSDCKQLSWVAY